MTMRESERTLRFVQVVGVINRLIASPNDNIIVIIISLASQWPPLTLALLEVASGKLEFLTLCMQHAKN